MTSSRAFKMFWDKPLHYREDPAIPATMIFETDALTPEADVSKLLNAPFIKAAGVAILVVANTAAPEMVADVPVEGILGRGYTTTTLPEIETGEASSTLCCRSRLHRTSRRQNCLNLRRMSYELLWLCCY